MAVNTDVHWSPTEFDYHQVKDHPTSRISPSCSLVGDIALGENVSVMAGCHLRADDDKIIVGDGCNIQEGVIIHEDAGMPVIIGKNSSVGHHAMLHGCQIGENCMVGMSATIMNGAKIGNNSVVAAGALVTEGKEFPDNSLIVGVPGKVKRELSEQEVFDMCTYPALDYVRLSEAMLNDGVLFNPGPDFNFQA